jgi:hypothetical protein
MSWSSLLNPILVLASFSPLFLLWAIQGPPTPINEFIQSLPIIALRNIHFHFSVLRPYELLCISAILIPNLFLFSEIKRAKKLNITHGLSIIDVRSFSDCTVEAAE